MAPLVGQSRATGYRGQAEAALSLTARGRLNANRINSPDRPEGASYGPRRNAAHPRFAAGSGRGWS